MPTSDITEGNLKKRKRKGLGNVGASAKSRHSYIKRARGRFGDLSSKQRGSRIEKLKGRLGTTPAHASDADIASRRARITAKLTALRGKPVRSALKKEFGKDFRSELKGKVEGYKSLGGYRADMGRIKHLEGITAGRTSEQDAKLAKLREKTSAASASATALKQKRKAARQKALGSSYGKYY